MATEERERMNAPNRVSATRVRLFIKPYCGWCREAMAWLDRRRIPYEALDVIRVYTKEPGKEPDRGRPFVLPRGARVRDLARHIHNDLDDRPKFARLWGKAVFEGQSVNRDHVLADEDVVELHTR